MNKKIIWVLVAVALLGLVAYYVVISRDSADSMDEVMTEDGFVFNEDTYETVKVVSNGAGAELLFTRNTNLFTTEEVGDYKGCGGLGAGLVFSCHMFVANDGGTPLFIGTLRTIAGINEGTFVSFVNSENARFSEAGGYDGFEYIDMYNINIKTGEVTKVE